MPPLDRKSEDESWFMEPKMSPLDLNPYFGSKSASMLVVSDQHIAFASRVQKKQNRKKSAYETFYKDFVDMMDKADSNNNEVMTHIKSKFSAMKIEMLQIISKSKTPSSDSVISSLPNIERCSTRKRLAPPSSPSRSKKRKSCET